jgi:hypothetical protein
MRGRALRFRPGQVEAPVCDTLAIALAGVLVHCVCRARWFGVHDVCRENVAGGNLGRRADFR